MDKLCSVTDCASKHHAKGFCAMHHARFKTYGTTDLPERIIRNKYEVPCSAPGCSKNIGRKGGKGLCRVHYGRLVRLGMFELKTISQRFWDKVDKDGGEKSCWPWKGGCGTGGYGLQSIKGKNIPASRVAWSLAKGDIPYGMLVCHRCDNPPCCNPGHLFLGTQADNVADKISKGRSRIPLGEDAILSKITERDVKAIRYLCAEGYTHRWIGRIFNISHTNVSSIFRRASWKHVK